ncbi:hypothetical protein [uncultured Victivallis sp.]|uniref:hypothetical protein n=1 Tax=uncultured Victivallis sp. TaxID=354118 RepID=UPI002599BE43|nr:hypothetical protein [uncultured Victivallis sp.]
MAVKIEWDFGTVRARIGAGDARMRSAADRAMSDVASFVASEAKDRTPVLTGALTMDVTGETGREGDTAIAAVKVPSNSPAASYAVKMHEEAYNPGPGSIDKQRRTGQRVGKKYITRAIDDNREKIRRILIETLRKAFEK